MREQSHPIKVLLLYGGRSGEHEVSLMSAASVLSTLDPQRYQVIPVGMDKEGCCYLNSYDDLINYKKSLPVRTSHSKPLPSLIANAKLAIHADVVFPVVHGPLYEDGCLQGLLELADAAYVGCGVLSSAIAMDKDMQRRVACVDGIKSARYRLLSSCASEDEVSLFCQETVDAFGWPLFVKPCSLGSSVGIQKVNSMDELLLAVSDASRYDEEILVEEFISGREIEISVLGNKSPGLPPLVSLPGEICVRHKDGFYSYAAKYLESSETDLIVPADLDKELIRRLQETAAAIFTRVKCRGMARVDFFVDDKQGHIYFNELNTLPGFTSISMYPKMWEASGLPYATLLDNLIDLAIHHHSYRSSLVRDYQ